MKFRFCGDLDCPDWVLAQIAALAKLTSIKLKLLCNEIVKHLLNNEMKFDKVEKLTSDSKLDTEDTKSCVAALLFILSSATKYHLDSDTLAHELQQLGLPKEHSSSLCKTYSDNLENIQKALKEKSLRLSRLSGVKYQILSQFSTHTFKVSAPIVSLTLETTHANQNKELQLSLTPDKLALLIYELKQAQQLMNEMS